MDLTKEKIIELGFELDNPDYALNKWYLYSRNPEYRISINQEYLPMSNKLSFNVNCWSCDEHGTIVKRASLSDVRTVEDLQTIISLCNIKL